MLVINPKRVTEEVEEKPYWYNYYAGYSHSFAKNIIDSSGLTESSIILDPWNGAGTTTLMSSIGGYRSVGIDLNPVMKVIATAKQATRNDVEFVEAKLRKLSGIRSRVTQENDPLRYWFKESGVLAVRRIENWILEGGRFDGMVSKIESLSPQQCVLYTALYNCVRENLKGFIPSNPTWIKRPKSDAEKVEIEWLVFKRRYAYLVSEMLKGLSLGTHVWPPDRASLIIASSANLPLPENCVDLVLSSPPYCTRIDYGIATLPELAIMSDSSADRMDDVRRSLMGTTTVSKKLEYNEVALGSVCAKFLSEVQGHSSKASATYYYKNILKYFLDLSKSLVEVSRVMKVGATFVCVVQDSFYKDVHCDLPSILVDIALISGLNLDQKHDFESRQNMVNLNAKSKSYRDQSTAYESVLIFSK
ncbi:MULTISPECIES: hypothetical protein [Pseudomonas]|uniref:DNA methylase N-4/N-6 domain-containing protein n=2 Tax=Pseudomonas TaxID=286 RepID=A0A3M3E966_9PSED|nr:MULTISPECIES: hypothetical protein [Pseudomonas]KPW97937.1 hypothetical protein ALO79_200341 [Pseudomonas syringae pv. castaneae]RMM45249.1 hypothetical protein ALQ77_02020 [Pseudomonas corrugata]SDV04317.1 hypothetical protein SAMN04490183_3601 [Pseudomonas corrugata]